jgi:hypothetical protein
MRVYVPATLPLVADLVSAGSLPAPVEAYAVTDVLRAWADQSGPSDDEELELVALSEAARGSLRLLDGAGAGSPSLRVVLAADPPDSRVRVDDRSDDAGPGQVVVTGGLELAWVKAAHVDDPAASGDVRAAVRSVLAADADDAAAEEVVARLERHDLLWYAAGELQGLVASRP